MEGKAFLHGGKEVLIKAVARAIPTYTMSCFKLPRGICEEINKLCAKFWWGSIGEKSKAHWMSWKKLCASKERGGLGFRDISLFNQAMLAKQSWRIIKNSNSLLAKVLRGRYFKHNNFLEASLGSNPSLTWKSILWGRDLFKQGMRWRVGNGAIIRIKDDLWIPGGGNFKPVCIQEDLSEAYVKELIDEIGVWKDGVIRSSFIPSEVESILDIPLGGKDARDQILWDPDPKGFFSVKSAYYLLTALTRWILFPLQTSRR